MATSQEMHKEDMKVDTDKKTCFFEEFLPEELETVLETQDPEYSEKQ